MTALRRHHVHAHSAMTCPPAVGQLSQTIQHILCRETSMMSVNQVATPVGADARLNFTHAVQQRDGTAILALDLGTTTGWALCCADGAIVSGTMSFRPSRYEGGGMRYLRFRSWLNEVANRAGEIGTVRFEEVRRHIGTDAAHLYGGFLAHLSAWCEVQKIAYQGVPVGTIKKFVCGKGNADKQAVIAAVRARGFNPADDNEADAIAILLWAMETQGGVR